MKKKFFVTRLVFCTIVIIVAGVLIYSFLSDYIKSRPAFDYCFGENTLQHMVEYSDTRFAVLSDPHYYDINLGTTGTAFEAARQSDSKLLEDSGALIDLAVNKILASQVDFILIPGDLTKDGEQVCHQQFAEGMARLTTQGIRVFVVPGNHDVNNPEAFRYEGEQSIPVPTVSSDEFAGIYHEMGYGSALYRDQNSLSYVAELNESLWLLAIDTCRSEENKPGGKEIVGGKLDKEQEKWIEDMLARAKKREKAVIVMAHHGINEHWQGENKFSESFLVENYEYIGKLLASYNVRIAFTGHFHAQDITLVDFKEQGFLYDIETGSLVTPPCAVRFCSLENNQLTIWSEFLVGQVYPGTNHGVEVNQFVFDVVSLKARKTLKKLMVSEKDATVIADHAALAFMAHYSGDEDTTQMSSLDVKKLGLWSRIVYSRLDYVVEGLWTDMDPPDNDTTLDLTGLTVSQ